MAISKIPTTKYHIFVPLAVVGIDILLFLTIHKFTKCSRSSLYSKRSEKSKFSHTFLPFNVGDIVFNVSKYVVSPDEIFLRLYSISSPFS